MINDKWLIALAKCRQIPRQIRPSLATDAILDVLLSSTMRFHDLINHDGVFKMDDDYCHPLIGR